MKKFLKVCIFAAIIMLLITSMVFAETETNDKIKVEVTGNDKVAKDEEFTLNVNIDTDTNIFGVQGKLVYNKDSFELVDTKTSLDEWKITAFNEDTGVFMMEISDNGLFSGEGCINGKQDVMQITLKAKEEIKKETVGIEDVTIAIEDENGEINSVKLTNVTNKIINDSNTTMIISIIALIAIIIIVVIFAKKK